MKTKRVLRYMIEIEHGIDNYVDDLPAHDDQEFIPAGRMVQIEFRDENGMIQTDDVWLPPGPSAATHLPPARTKGHSRGYLVDTRTNRAVSFASTYEFHCALDLLINKAVVDIEDQPPALPYIDAEGIERHHRFDYRATLMNGVQLAFAVKPLDQVESSKIEDILERLKPNLPGFANAVFLVTDRTLTRDRAWNAKAILRALKVRSERDCTRMLAIIPKTQGVFSAYALARTFERFADGLNAIWCLIYDGIIELAEPSRKLVDAPWIRFCKAER